jgi:hypothetical protein
MNYSEARPICVNRINRDGSIFCYSFGALELWTGSTLRADSGFPGITVLSDRNIGYDISA